jgi:hypothetical protein
MKQASKLVDNFGRKLIIMSSYVRRAGLALIKLGTISLAPLILSMRQFLKLDLSKLTDKQAAAQVALQSSFRGLKDTLNKLVAVIGEQLAPHIEKAIFWLRKAINSIADFLRQNQQFLPRLIQISGAALAAGGALKVFGSVMVLVGAGSRVFGYTLDKISSTVAGLRAGFKGLKQAVLGIASPLAQIKQQLGAVTSSKQQEYMANLKSLFDRTAKAYKAAGVRDPKALLRAMAAEAKTPEHKKLVKQITEAVSPLEGIRPTKRSAEATAAAIVKAYKAEQEAGLAILKEAWRQRQVYLTKVAAMQGKSGINRLAQWQRGVRTAGEIAKDAVAFDKAIRGAGYLGTTMNAFSARLALSARDFTAHAQKVKATTKEYKSLYSTLRFMSGKGVALLGRAARGFGGGAAEFGRGLLPGLLKLKQLFVGLGSALVRSIPHIASMAASYVILDRVIKSVGRGLEKHAIAMKGLPGWRQDFATLSASAYNALASGDLANAIADTWHNIVLIFNRATIAISHMLEGVVVDLGVVIEALDRAWKKAVYITKLAKAPFMRGMGVERKVVSEKALAEYQRRRTQIVQEERGFPYATARETREKIAALEKWYADQLAAIDKAHPPEETWDQYLRRITEEYEKGMQDADKFAWQLRDGIDKYLKDVVANFKEQRAQYLADITARGEAQAAATLGLYREDMIRLAAEIDEAEVKAGELLREQLKPTEQEKGPDLTQVRSGFYAFNTLAFKAGQMITSPMTKAVQTGIDNSKLIAETIKQSDLLRRQLEVSAKAYNELKAAVSF